MIFRFKQIARLGLKLLNWTVLDSSLLWARKLLINSQYCTIVKQKYSLSRPSMCSVLLCREVQGWSPPAMASPIWPPPPLPSMVSRPTQCMVRTHPYPALHHVCLNLCLFCYFLIFGHSLGCFLLHIVPLLHKPTFWSGGFSSHSNYCMCFVLAV